MKIPGITLLRKSLLSLLNETSLKTINENLKNWNMETIEAIKNREK